MVERMLPWFDQAFGLTLGGPALLQRRRRRARRAASARTRATPQNLIPLVMKAATGRAPTIKVFGTDYPTPDGTCIRDYIHVLDLADAHLKALDFLAAAATATSSTWAPASGASVKEVLAAARKASGKTIPTEFVARRPGDPVSVLADNAKARTLLKWTPRYGLPEIVASAWKWHSTHPGRVQDHLGGSQAG